MNTKEQEQYTALILGKIGELFDEQPELLKELSEGDNATEFIHSLANIVPTQFYNQLTSSNETMLSFNHIANRLVFQNSKSISKTEE